MEQRYTKILTAVLFAGTVFFLLAAGLVGRAQSDSSDLFLCTVLMAAGIACALLSVYEYMRLCRLQKQETEEKVLQAHLSERKKILYEEENRSGKQTELYALQTQINPHFLYNTLDSIRGQALIDGADEIADMTEALSAFFRYSISRRGNLVALKDEIRNVEHYMKIQQFRFDDKYILKKRVDVSAETLETTVPKMILQPLVENAIVHGLESREEQGTVTLRVDETQYKIRIMVEDNGVGMPQEEVRRLNDRLHDVLPDETGRGSEGTGIALTNVNERIRLYFGTQYGLRVSSLPGVGTQAQILIPKEPDSGDRSMTGTQQKKTDR